MTLKEAIKRIEKSGFPLDRCTLLSNTGEAYRLRTLKPLVQYYVHPTTNPNQPSLLTDSNADWIKHIVIDYPS